MTASDDRATTPARWTPQRVSHVTDALEELWGVAIGTVRQRRGGTRYLADLFGTDHPDTALATFVADGALWAVGDVDAFMVIRDQVIVALYVRVERRRLGLGRALVHVARAEAAHDALVLPGDRAMKSLFESIGWKARLLTLGDA